VLLLEYDQLKFEDLYTDSRKCSALFPTVANVQLFYTISSVQLKRFQEAIDAAEIGLTLVVNDPISESEFYAQRADANFALKKYAEGKRDYEKAISLTPKNNLIKNNFAMRLAIANLDLDLANKYIDEVLKNTSNQAPFIDTKGMILFQKGDYKNALKQFTIASELDQSNPSYLDHMGDALVKLGDHALAIESWNKALNLGSKNKSILQKIQTKKYVSPEY
jgi:tetratricopeptide (TPR) repeat protein